MSETSGTFDVEKIERMSKHMSKHNGKLADVPSKEPERELPQVCGGDGQNYWYFYSGGGYGNNSPANIAQWAKENIDYFKDKSVDDIRENHVYWGTESSRFHGFYNGDTNVLFGDPDKLPERQRMDAYENVPSLREAAKAKAEERSRIAEADLQYDTYREAVKSGAERYENLDEKTASRMSDAQLCRLYDDAMIERDLGDD